MFLSESTMKLEIGLRRKYRCTLTDNSSFFLIAFAPHLPKAIARATPAKLLADVIDIDALQVFGAPVAAGSYDDAHAAWQYLPSWTVYTGPGPANNTLRYTNTVGNYTSVLFTGTQFTLTFSKYSNRGLIDVYVDGVKITTLNANSASLMWQQTYTSPVLRQPPHPLRARRKC